MKLECVKEKLVEALGKAEKITGKNLTLPVLACVFLEAKNNTLTIRATNLDLGIEIVIPVKVIDEGSIAVPGSVVYSFVSQVYGDKNIILEVVDGNLHIVTKNISTTVKSLNKEDFPTIPKVTPEFSFKTNSQDFVRGLKSVWYSSSISSVKPELASVYVYNNDSNLVFVATDSFRLAERKVLLKNSKDFPSILIPFKNTTEIIRILEESGGEIEIHSNKNQIAFVSNNLYITSRLIDGMFPDYKQIIPKDPKTEVVVLKDDLLRSLKIAHIFSDTFNQINIKVFPGKKLFELSTKNHTIGQNSTALEAVLTGEDIDMNFNYKYIIDCFQSIDSDSVSINFYGANRPVIIRGVSDKLFTYLVMPMNK